MEITRELQNLESRCIAHVRKVIELKGLFNLMLISIKVAIRNITKFKIQTYVPHFAKGRIFLEKKIASETGSRLAHNSKYNSELPLR